MRELTLSEASKVDGGVNWFAVGRAAGAVVAVGGAAGVVVVVGAVAVVGGYYLVNAIVD